MGDDYLSLYEAVDYEELSGASRPQSVGQQNKYQVLSNAAAQKLNDYDQLKVCSSESDVKLELKCVKKELKSLKLVAIVGLITVVCLAAAAVVAIILAINASRQPPVQVNSHLDNRLLNIFENCSEEVHSCNINYEVNNRLLCNTKMLPLRKKVSEYTFNNNFMKDEVQCQDEPGVQRCIKIYFI